MEAGWEEREGRDAPVPTCTSLSLKPESNDTIERWRLQEVLFRFVSREDVQGSRFKNVVRWEEGSCGDSSIAGVYVGQNNSLDASTVTKDRAGRPLI